MKSWDAKCPYCKANFVHGYGNYTVPEAFIPLMRCKVCGKLVKTGANEFLTTPVEERIKFKKDRVSCKYIAQSLDRTNNQEYLSFLQAEGYIIYPVTKEDKLKFTKISFDNCLDKAPSEEATQSLYNVGILIQEKFKDEQTGGFKKEVLDKNRAEYNTTVKTLRWGIITGLIVGMFSCCMFMGIDADSLLPFLGILFGIAAGAIAGFLANRYYKNKSNKQIDNINENNTNKKL